MWGSIECWSQSRRLPNASMQSACDSASSTSSSSCSTRSFPNPLPCPSAWSSAGSRGRTCCCWSGLVPTIKMTKGWTNSFSHSSKQIGWLMMTTTRCSRRGGALDLRSWTWSLGPWEVCQCRALTCQSGYVNLLFVFCHRAAACPPKLSLWLCGLHIPVSRHPGSICVSGDLTILFIRRRTHFQCTPVSSDKPAGSNNYYRINNRLPAGPPLHRESNLRLPHTTHHHICTKCGT